MNQWGAVKLGMVVATAGALGILGSGKNSAQTHSTPSYALSSFRGFHTMQGMVAGSANNLGDGQASSSGGLDMLKAAASRGGSDFNRSGAAPGRALVPQGAVRKIVRSASVCFEVKDQSKARALVHGVAIRNGAEIFSEESAGSGENESGVIVIQASPDKLDAILKELEPLGRVVSRSVASDNMSEEYVDLNSRLQNFRKVEARLTNLMQFKTNKLSDILELERELDRVGGEIEQTIGRMKYIDTLAASSRITVRMAQPVVVQAEQAAAATGIIAQVRNSFVGSFNTFVSTGLTLLSMTGFLLALGLWTLPVAGVIWLLKTKLFSSHQ